MVPGGPRGAGKVTDVIVRRFTEPDAKAVSDLVTETMRVSNTKDYPVETMEGLIRRHQPEHILERAGKSHFYVAEEGGVIVGCGAVGPYQGKEDESILTTIFVLPAYQGKGVGRSILEALEADEYALRAERIVLSASITGFGFYRKLGYVYQDGRTEMDENGLYSMEKRQGQAVPRAAAKETGDAP